MFCVGRTKNLGTCRACFYAGHAPLCPAYNKGATSKFVSGFLYPTGEHYYETINMFFV